MFGTSSLALETATQTMAYSRGSTNWTDRQRLISSVAALGAGASGIRSLTAAGRGYGRRGLLLALASVAFVGVRTRSIELSEQEHV